jgi:hypothetical protein
MLKLVEYIGLSVTAVALGFLFTPALADNHPIPCLVNSSCDFPPTRRIGDHVAYCRFGHCSTAKCITDNHCAANEVCNNVWLCEAVECKSNRDCNTSKGQVCETRTNVRNRYECVTGSNTVTARVVRLIDGRVGDPLPGVEVTLENGPQKMLRRTSANGVATFPRVINGRTTFSALQRGVRNQLICSPGRAVNNIWKQRYHYYQGMCPRSGD